jgi:hypothetical protein
MRNWNQAIAILCISGLLPLPCAAEGRRESVADVQRLVDQLGSGADLKVTFEDGHKVRGQVGAIQSEGFELLSRHHDHASYVRYDEITTVRLARRVYRSANGRDPSAARRVAFALGRGHHVLARVLTGKTYRGHIETLEAQGFTVRLDHTGQAVPLSYSEIDHLEQNLSRGAKIGLLAAAAGAIVLIVILRKIEYDD